MEFTHKKRTPGLHGKNTKIAHVKKAKKIYVYITFLSLLALTSAKIIDQLIQTHEINIQSNHKHVKLSKNTDCNHEKKSFNVFVFSAHAFFVRVDFFVVVEAVRFLLTAVALEDDGLGMRSSRLRFSAT